MFERIIRETDTAYIRDTEIPVKTIIDLIQSGKSSSEIFTTYPILETDDLIRVFNHLTRAVEESYSQIAHDIRVHTTSFLGYSDLIKFVMNQNNLDQPQIISFLNMIIENAKQLDTFARDISGPITSLTN
jgi:uncharacterized protein (DUF433 family)